MEKIHQKVICYVNSKFRYSGKLISQDKDSYTIFDIQKGVVVLPKSQTVMEMCGEVKE